MNGFFAGSTTSKTFIHNTGVKGPLTVTYTVCGGSPSTCANVTAIC